MATPSGIRHSLAKTFLSEPSGFTEKMRPWLASRKIKRAAAVLLNGARVDFVVRGSVTFVLIIVLSLLIHVSITPQPLWPGRRLVVFLQLSGRSSRSPLNPLRLPPSPAQPTSA